MNLASSGSASTARPRTVSNNAPSADATSRPLKGLADLESLTDDALVESVDDLSRRERLTTLEVLLHLVEIERRRLWFSMEYRSMFDYCVRRLHYSEGAANRRIRTARLIVRYPAVLDRLREGRLSLCVVSKIARAVLEDGRTDLIDQVEGKRLDQVDAILATHRNPSRPVRESIRLLCVERPVERPEDAAVQPPPSVGAPEPARAGDDSLAQAGPGDGSSAQAAPGAPDDRRQNGGKKFTRVERVFKFQFGIDAETMTKFARVQSIAATRAGRHVDLSELFGVLCDTYLERHDPVRRAVSRSKRRDQRNAGVAQATRKGERSVGTSQEGAQSPRRARRHIPEAIRDAVFIRDGGRCTFVDKGGERCTETIGLQVDHIRPFALGGRSQASNLRLLCGTHNRLLAERTFGEKKPVPARDP